MNLISRRYLVLILGVIVVMAVVGAYFLWTNKPFKEEAIGGKYNAKLIIEGNDTRGFEYGFIVYTVGGVEHRGFYNSYLKNALDWIKTNTPENSTFLCWWDHGHMICGYAERESIVKNPSKEALVSVADKYKSTIKEFDPHEKILDVAYALTTTNENITKEIMEKYDAKYLLITTEDGGGKAPWIFHFAGLNYTNYYRPTFDFEGGLVFRSKDYTELGKQTMIFKLLTNTNMQFFNIVYSDENVKIFKVSN